ncbi:hypothetical protein E2C01_042312 [Portunus trituberculatus]|uniref:Uncharacterized protein n=1 Tax=Portunus trituberculatus TaxID=210409 RepID=A0A5B7FT42_PORTR|nr:hypothetical protein [Portunus trituberculatus]
MDSAEKCSYRQPITLSCKTPPRSSCAIDHVLHHSALPSGSSSRHDQDFKNRAPALKPLNPELQL